MHDIVQSTLTGPGLCKNAQQYSAGPIMHEIAQGTLTGPGQYKNAQQYTAGPIMHEIAQSTLTGPRLCKNAQQYTAGPIRDLTTRRGAPRPGTRRVYSGGLTARLQEDI